MGSRRGLRLAVGAIAIVCATCVAGAGSALAGSIIGGSSLINAADLAQIETWLGLGPIDLTNVYTKSGGDTAADFHGAADGLGPTIVIYEANGTPAGPQLIGGYSPASWTTAGGYTQTPDPVDMVSIIFNLTQTFYLEQTDKYQAFNHTNFGPTFGGGHDILVDDSLAGGYVHPFNYCTPGTVTKPGTCFDIGDPDILALTPNGVQNVNWGGIEVFTISAVPEPSGVLLLVMGLSAAVVCLKAR